MKLKIIPIKETKKTPFGSFVIHHQTIQLKSLGMICQELIEKIEMKHRNLTLDEFNNIKDTIREHFEDLAQNAEE